MTPLVLGVLLATIIQGLTSFTLTQLLSKSAQKMITELRRKVQAHIGRLPIAFYDTNKTGALVSRIMSDVEGVRNLVGTGLVEFAGGLMTALVCVDLLDSHQRPADRRGRVHSFSLCVWNQPGLFDDSSDFSRAPQKSRRKSRAGLPNRSVACAW